MTLDEYIAARVAGENAKRPSTARRASTNEERGLVISAPIEVSSTGLRIKNTNLDPQELRFSLLFWDKLDYPSNNLIEVSPGPEADFLVSAGVLNRTHVNITSASGGDILRLPLIRAFQILSEKEPGAWSVATGERSISFLDSELSDGRGALVGLHRAIPVPDKAVPLEDVLNFRRKRRSELLALRHHLETIYGRVSNAGDEALALNSETEALERAVMDYIKSIKGSRLKWRLADLTASVSLTKGTTVGMAAYAAGLPAISSILTGGMAALDIKTGAGLSRGRSSETPFRYVSSYHKELFPLS